MNKNLKKRLIILISYFVGLFLLTVIYYFLFTKAKIFIPCFFHELTGLYCPGCGITRMIISILKLEFYQAFRYNPLLFILLPFFIVLMCDYLKKWLLYKEDYLYKKIGNKTWVTLIVVLILFAILRNIPCFDFLKPVIILS